MEDKKLRPCNIQPQRNQKEIHQVVEIMNDPHKMWGSGGFILQSARNLSDDAGYRLTRRFDLYQFLRQEKLDIFFDHRQFLNLRGT
jgi:hypothetical protein